jgi:plastocyanin
VPQQASPIRPVIRPALTAALSAALAFSGPGAGDAETERGAQPGATTSDLSGRVTLLLPPSIKVDPGGVVVWIPGLTIGAPAPPRASVTSRDKRFEPRTLVVPKGTRVTFPNVDPIYHNAFSLSPGNAFDLGLYRKGASREATLARPGVVRVYCNIHPEMASAIVVTDGDAATVAGADGTFRLAGIPPGTHEVRLWSDIAGERVEKLVFEAGKTTDWSPVLDATTYRRAAHLNKHGKPYPKAKSGADRY